MSDSGVERIDVLDRPASRAQRRLASLRRALADWTPEWSRADTSLALCLVTLFALRYAVLSPFAVAGADNANYLLTMRQVSGDDPTGMGLLRPPMVGLLLRPFVELMPLTLALKLVGVGSSLVIAFPFFKLSQRLLSIVTPRPGLPALLATLGFVSSYQFAAMLAFGWLTFCGIFLVLLLVIKGLDMEGQPSKANVAAFALLLLLIAATHQTTFFISVLLMAFVALPLAALSLHRGTRSALLRRYTAYIGVGLGLGGVVSLPLAPLYLRHSSDYTSDQWPGSLVAVDNLRFQLESFFHDAPTLWLLAAWMALVGLAVVARYRGAAAALWPLGLLLAPIATGLLGMDISHRALMFSYIPLWLLAPVGLLWNLNGLARQMDGHARLRHVAALAGHVAPIAVIGAMLGFQALTGARYLQQQAFTHSSIDADTIQAARWVSSQLPPGRPVIAYPFSLGWWLEGAEGVNALEVGSFPRRSQTFESDMAQAALFGSDVVLNGRLGLAWTNAPDLPLGPQILVRAEREYQLSSYFSEAETAIVLADGRSDEAIRLSELERAFEVRQDEDGIAGLTAYSGDLLAATQTAILRGGPDQAIVSYAFEAGQGYTIGRVEIPLRFNPLLTRRVEALQDSTVLVNHLGITHKFLPQPVMIAIAHRATGAAVEVEILEDSLARFTLVPGDGEGRLYLDLVFDFSGLAPWKEEAVYINSRQVLDEYEVSAVVVDERPVNGLVPLSEVQMQWLSGSPLYRQVYRTGRLSVFEVVTSPE